MEKVFEYNPVGVCSRKMTFMLDDNTIKSVKIDGGCHGYSQGMSKILVGMNIDEVISKLNGIKCGNKNTSCPDQITKALELYRKS